MSTPLPTDRAAYRVAVAQVAEQASQKLPDSLGRIDSAVKLVLAGDVEVLPDGDAMVASRSNARVEYHLVNGVCDCADYARAPGNLCAHRLAYGIARRAAELTPALPAPAAATGAATVASAPLGEAPASVNCHILIEGRQVQITLRDTDEQRLLERLGAILRQYPVPATPPAAPRPQGQDKGWCQIHNVQMQENHKDGRTWFSHRNPDGDGWCKGRRR
jgi:hypothetical protein